MNRFLDNKLIGFSIKTMIDEGKSDKDIADEYFGSFVRYNKGFTLYRELSRANVAREVQVFVLWGRPGTGKTRIIFETYPNVWIASDPTLQWFDGYEGQDTLLLDDYRGDAKSAFMLRLLDRYPLKVPVKGSFKAWLPTRIFITSNIAPPFGHDDVAEPFRRRVKHVIKLDHNIYRDGADNEIEVIKNLIN